MHVSQGNALNDKVLRQFGFHGFYVIRGPGRDPEHIKSKEEGVWGPESGGRESFLLFTFSLAN